MASIRKRGESFTISVSMGYDASGRQIRKSTTYHPPEGVTAGKAEKLARQYAAVWEDQIRGYASLDENRTFGDLVEWYFTSVAPLKLKPNVLADDRRMIESYVMPTLSRKKLKDISPTVLDTLFANMKTGGRTWDTYILKDGVRIGRWSKYERNLTDLAQDTGLSRMTLQRLSSGHPVQKENAQKIADCLGAEFDDMFITSVADRSLSESTVSRVRRVLSSIFSEAVRKEIMRRNPVSNTTSLSKKSKKCPRYLDEQQAFALVEALERQDDFQFKVAINTLLYTGMRGGELCGLQWDDIDFESGVIYIRRTLTYIPKMGTQAARYELHSPKTAAGERYVVMPSPLPPLLKEQRQRQEAFLREKGLENPNNMVFLSIHGNYYTVSRLNIKFKKLANELGFPDDIHLHSLRHTTASLLINSGVPSKVIAEQLGHSSASVTENIYAHIFESSKAKAAQALEISLRPALQ